MSLYDTLLTMHIAGGFTALFTSFIALATKSMNIAHKWHVYSGRIYFWGMVIVFVTAIPMTMIKINIFLFLIAIFSFYSAFVGWRLAKNRRGTPALIDWFSAGLMGITAVGMILYGGYLLTQSNSNGITILIFGVIGALLSSSDLQINRADGVKGKERIALHLSRMLGATIATVTAFLVTNFSVEPAFILWLAPAILITPIIAWWNRRILGGHKVSAIQITS